MFEQVMIFYSMLAQDIVTNLLSSLAFTISNEMGSHIMQISETKMGEWNKFSFQYVHD